jgi:hypothetical protein
MKTLEIPIPVTFTIKLETERAYIVNNVILSGELYVREAVLPKMFTIIKATKNENTSALVEKWVLQQRYIEENTVDVEAHIEELKSLVKVNN